MAVLLKTTSVRVSFIQIMQVRVQNKGKSVWKSRYVGDVSGTSEDDITLHRCHRSHLRNIIYLEGTNTGKQGRTQSMQCDNMMHECDMAI